MKKYSKRLLCSCVSAIGVIGTYSLAGTTGMSITLAPGWNVVSTPAILSSLSFSNGGNGISFSKLVNEKRQTVSATTENIKPLEGFMVNNSNASAVTLTMQYKAGVSVTESLLKSDLNHGRNLLGITTTDHPFSHLTGASMSVDFTNGSNQGVSSNFTINTTSKDVSNPQLGKAYGIFVNTQNAIYGGVNNGGIVIDGTSTGGTTSGGNTSTGTGTTGTGNSGEIGSGTTVTSGTNEGVIFQNKLKDIVLYSGLVGDKRVGGQFQDTNIAFDNGIWYNENNQDLFFDKESCSYSATERSNCNVMIASGKVQVTESGKSVSFSIKSNTGTNDRYSSLMYLKIGNNTYHTGCILSSNKCVWNFNDISVFPNVSFTIYLQGVSPFQDFSMSDDSLGLKLRKFTFVDRDLFTMNQDSFNKIVLHVAEKSSHVLYSGTFTITTGLTLNHLYGMLTWFTFPALYDRPYFVNNVINFIHVFIDDNEIWNSDEELFATSAHASSLMEINPVKLQAGTHTIKMLVDVLPRGTDPDGRRIVHQFYLGLEMDNGNRYRFPFGNSPIYEIQNTNINTLVGNDDFSRQCCIFENNDNTKYKYYSCIKDSNGDKKVIVFRGTYTANESPITLTGFMINHLTGKNFDNVYLNFELYINDELVKTFGMDEINHVLSLDDIEISTTATSVELLAVPYGHNAYPNSDVGGDFQGSITFYRRYSDNSGTPRHDSVETRTEVTSFTTKGDSSCIK